MNEKKASGTRSRQPSPGAANPPHNRPPWSVVEREVARLQQQIAAASQRGDRQALHVLQQRMLESEAARLLAVRRAAEENQGKDTAGVDGVKSLTASERLAMVAAIHPRHWNQQPSLPVRRAWIPKPGKTERRPLGILPMLDRCKQALVKLALEPEWETCFEAQSYGFRPGRGTHDAIAAILKRIKHRPVFVFNADIEAAFDQVNQAVVLDKLQTFPVLRQAITAWLTAGVLDGTTYHSSEQGIGQGGILSPLLMNVALHGMDAVVTAGAARNQSREQPLLVRYADNFVVLHPELKELQQAARRVKHWLAMMGLHLHPHKTHFTHTLTPYQGRVGFDYLGFGIRQEREEPLSRGQRRQRGNTWRTPQPAVKTVITPSQEASTRHQAALEHKLQSLQTAPQDRVIAELNPIILGWATYYAGVVPVSTMGQYDDLLEQRLITWASKRHPGKARDWLFSRYWHPLGEQGSVFATHDGVQVRSYQQPGGLKRGQVRLPIGNENEDES